MSKETLPGLKSFRKKKFQKLHQECILTLLFNLAVIIDVVGVIDRR